MINLKRNSDDHLPPVELMYNSSYHSNIQMASLKLYMVINADLKLVDLRLVRLLYMGVDASLQLVV